MEVNDHSVICDFCGGFLVENIWTGEMICDTCNVIILVDGTVDKSNCEE